MTYSATHNHCPYSPNSWAEISKQPQLFKNKLKYFFQALKIFNQPSNFISTLTFYIYIFVFIPPLTILERLDQIPLTLASLSPSPILKRKVAYMLLKQISLEGSREILVGGNKQSTLRTQNVKIEDLLTYRTPLLKRDSQLISLADLMNKSNSNKKKDSTSASHSVVITSADSLSR